MDLIGRVTVAGDGKIEMIEIAPRWRGRGFARLLVELSRGTYCVAGSVEGERLFKRLGWTERGVYMYRAA